MFLSDVWLDPAALYRFGSICREAQGGYEAGIISGRSSGVASVDWRTARRPLTINGPVSPTAATTGRSSSFSAGGPVSWRFWF